MKSVNITNKSNNGRIKISARICDTFLCKLRGYMFYKNIKEDEGLLFIENEESRLNASIHMLFMKFDLAVIWMNSQNRVVDKTLAKKWRLAYFPAKPSKYILETHKNRLNDFQLNDELVIKEI